MAAKQFQPLRTGHQLIVAFQAFVQVRAIQNYTGRFKHWTMPASGKWPRMAGYENTR